MFLQKSVINKIKPYLDIDTDKCIEYPTTNHDGYGIFQSIYHGKKMHYLMHRVAYQLYYKDNLNSDNIICHKCDNPRCINPRHLFKGTPADNVKDMVIKDRQAKGPKNGRWIDGRTLRHKSHTHSHGRKLTKNQVLKIRELRKQGVKCSKIAQIFNIKEFSVRDISCGRTYKCY